MKTYKNLWDQFISKENFELATKKAVKSKKSKRETIRFLAKQDELIEQLRHDLMRNKFTTSKYNIFLVFEPKKREIFELPLYPDHIVHHALINVLGPIWERRFIRDSYACIPGRGVHSAIKKTMQMIKKNKYVLQCDIRKFYPSINHEIMMNIIAKKIHDRKILQLLQKIVFSIDGGKNLPIGNLTSQWMGNVYLNVLDHFVKEQLRCMDYIRYCDDFCLFADDKKLLHQYRRKLKSFVEDVLRLTFSKATVFPVADGVAFIGYRHFKNFVLLRKRGAKKLKKRVMNVARYNDFSDFAVSQLASYHGWVRWCNSYNFLVRLYDDIRKISPQSLAFIESGLGRGRGGHRMKKQLPRAMDASDAPV